jgi:hypothetical protein
LEHCLPPRQQTRGCDLIVNTNHLWFVNHYKKGGWTHPDSRFDQLLQSVFLYWMHLSYEYDDVKGLGPIHTRDWEPVTLTLQALSLVEKAEPVQVRFTQRLRDRRSMWMQDGCKVYMDSYMASNGSCVLLAWTIFKNYLLEVGLTQNRETMALRMLTTVDVF